MSQIKDIPAHLVKRRRHAGLSQKELGRLLGTTKSSISKFEAQGVRPTFNFLLALQAIFDVSPRDAFPDSFAQVHKEVVRRAAELDTELRRRPYRDSAHKLAFLRALQDCGDSTPAA
ncbi:MAG: helix-turn-helix transcriptional regulator [Rhizomicrobium sp.]